MKTNDTTILHALQSVNPSDLARDDWLRIGMGLKAAELPCEVWDQWSQQDPDRYHPGECDRLWRGFNGTGITGATVVHYAKQAGWEASTAGATHTRWTMPPYAPGVDLKPFLSQFEKPAQEPPIAEATGDTEQLRRYLAAMFEPLESVIIVTRATWDKEKEKWKPQPPGRTHTVTDLLQGLMRPGATIESVIGKHVRDAGAWVRVNPCTGEGDRDVTRFRHALLESDEQDTEEQLKLIRKLNAPYSALVESGGKSIHGLVRVDAADKAEYDERVEYLYQAAEAIGLKVDRQNRNPSRMSRLAGVLRGHKQQRLVCTMAGDEDWEAWMEQREGPKVTFTPTKIHGSGPMPPPLFINGPLPGGFGLIVGEDTIGKGWVSLDLILSCALGKKINISTIHHSGPPLRVAYCCYEDPGPALEWRLDQICKLAGIDPREWWEAEEDGRLVIKADDELMPMFEQLPGRLPEPTAYLEALWQFVGKSHTDLLIIDPLAACAVLQNENDNAAMNQVAVQLRARAKQECCTTLLTHHTNKIGHGSQHHHAARGGAALPAAARWQLQLAQESEKAPLFMAVSKNSYGRRHFDIPMIREDAGPVRELTQADLAARASALMYRVKNWIEEHPEVHVNLNAIANRAGTARELITEMGASPAAVHDAATMAVENGYLKVQETITEKGRKVYILTTVNSGNNTYDDDEEIPFR